MQIEQIRAFCETYYAIQFNLGLHDWRCRGVDFSGRCQYCNLIAVFGTLPWTVWAVASVLRWRLNCRDRIVHDFFDQLCGQSVLFSQCQHPQYFERFEDEVNNVLRGQIPIEDLAQRLLDLESRGHCETYKNLSI